MNEQPNTPDASLRGSAWAALDRIFFALVDDLFPPSFLAGADTLLATKDGEASCEIRLAAMRRHPSNFRRF